MERLGGELLNVLGCIGASHVDILGELARAVGRDLCDLCLFNCGEWTFESDIRDQLLCERSGCAEKLW